MVKCSSFHPSTGNIVWVSCSYAQRLQAAPSSSYKLAAKMKDIFPKFALKNLSTFVAIIVIFIYNVVLNKDLECNCENKAPGCNVYMTMPFFILLLLQLLTEEMLSYKCFSRDGGSKSKTEVCCRTIQKLVKAVSIGLLWVVSLYIDGDWYVCCKDDRKFACKKENRTAEDRTAIAELKIHSLVTGMSILLGILVLAIGISCGESWNEKENGPEAGATEDRQQDQQRDQQQFVEQNQENIPLGQTPGPSDEVVDVNPQVIPLSTLG